MPSRQPIRHCDARKVAGQRATYTGLSGMMMNRAGAYFFHSRRFGSLAIVDDIALTEDEREAIAPYATPACEVYKRQAAVLLGDEFEIASFVSPKDLDARAPGGLRYFQRIHLWRFEQETWALLHLLTGITTRTRTDREALAIFDQHFAKSAHDRMRLRALVQQRQASA